MERKYSCLLFRWVWLSSSLASQPLLFASFGLNLKLSITSQSPFLKVLSHSRWSQYHTKIEPYALRGGLVPEITKPVLLHVRVLRTPKTAFNPFSRYDSCVTPSSRPCSCLWCAVSISFDCARRLHTAFPQIRTTNNVVAPSINWNIGSLF